jgi:hypothetical protein
MNGCRIGNYLCLTALFLLQLACGAEKVTPAAEWQPAPNFMRNMHEQCRDLSFPALGKCFVRQMRRAGASRAAVAFSHALKNEGYLQHLQVVGKVDVAYVVYPFRANENDACLLVNGHPSSIDVDKLSSLPQSSMKRDPTYRKLLRRYRNLSLWPGDRSPGDSSITAENTNSGGQRFLVHYWEQDGCHACARVGLTTFAFEFDSSGRFLGAKYVKTRRLAGAR